MKMEIRQKFTFLATEGLIYSTTDEEHFAAVWIKLIYHTYDCIQRTSVKENVST